MWRLKKRKWSVLTLETKLEIMWALEKGTSQWVVGDNFGVAKSTITDIWKDRQKIADSIASSESPAFTNRKRCIICHPKFHLVDEACWEWFCQQCSKDAPVSGVLLQEKACSFFTKLHPNNDPQSFKGSTGCLTKFNKCHGIKSDQLWGEVLSFDLSAVNPFHEKLAKVITEERSDFQCRWNRAMVAHDIFILPELRWNNLCR